jgi:hypothetical protein
MNQKAKPTGGQRSEMMIRNEKKRKRKAKQSKA